MTGVQTCALPILPASLHVISQAQGRITLNSEEGHGSKVEIHLPMARVTEEALSRDGISSILLVDDEDEWASAFASLLEGAGVKVTRQTSLKKLPDVDLVLVDEYCSALGVDEALAAIEKAGLTSKTVVLTAALNPERVTRYLRSGVKDVQPKPYTAAEIGALLQ